MGNDRAPGLLPGNRGGETRSQAATTRRAKGNPGMELSSWNFTGRGGRHPDIVALKRRQTTH